MLSEMYLLHWVVNERPARWTPPGEFGWPPDDKTAICVDTPWSALTPGKDIDYVETLTA